jgi:hypothetical protein
VTLFFLLRAYFFDEDSDATSNDAPSSFDSDDESGSLLQQGQNIAESAFVANVN